MPARSLLVVPLAAALLPVAASRLEVAGATRRGAPARAIAAHGAIPLSFERNDGQADARVRYMARGQGFSLFLTPEEAVLSLRSGGPAADRHPLRARPAPRPDGRAVVRMSLVGAKRTPEVVAAGEVAGKSHYLVGHDPRRWRTDVPHYARVTYKEVYPGVDLVYHGRQGRLEYDFVVSPGRDPGAIRVRLDGADAMHLDDRGDLVLETRAGRLVMEAPVVYQDVDGARRPVEGRYETRAGGYVGFEIGDYDARHPLVIDPAVELKYSTYLGGGLVDEAHAIAIDGTGSVYVTGTTVSTDFPAEGSIQPDQGGFDVFVSKLSPSGSDLVYSTYLGGEAADDGEAIAVDRAGSAYVTGHTLSTDFPTAGPFQADRPGVDAFVAKLSPSGSSLAYSTYLGGSEEEYGHAIAVDVLGQAFVAGETTSADFPTLGPFQGDQPGHDAFVTKLAASGAALAYSTYLGGLSFDVAHGIALDDAGSAYVTGETFSPDFPTVGPVQADQGGRDAFVTKLAPSGSTVVYSTYLGGGGADLANSVAVDGAGGAYVAGWTDSTDFPPAGAFQSDQGGRDAFVAKVSTSGSSFVYSTYLGGALEDVAEAVAVDAAGAAHVAGYTSSTDFPTANAQQTDQPLEDAFVARLSPAGSSLAWSTYLGGNGDDRASAVAADGAGSAYVAGHTSSANFPTVGAYQGGPGGGGSDAFVAKLATPTSQDFFTLAPCRAVDTRNAVSALGGPALACSPTPVPRVFPLAGACGIPPNARAVSYNVTVTEATSNGHLRLFPAAGALPTSSSINFLAGLNRANNGVVLLGAGHLGVTCHPVAGTAHVVIDVNGYFAETP
jgi:hypothetical protein